MNSGEFAISVVVLTRDRPAEFASLLRALSLQRLRQFDVVVVGAESNVEAHGAPADLAAGVTYAQCVERSISLSRNIGIALAKAEIIAFIDDDAAPEPDWLERLLPAFDDPKVGAVGGFVRGRNGVDFQWRGALVDRYGGHRALTREERRAPEKTAEAGEFFISTVGVNCAVRRAAIEEIGGFDENFHYFLDESDVCIRLSKRGWRIVFAPDAEVHHAYAASAERQRNRAPRDLFQIAASQAYFGRVHGHPDWFGYHLEGFRRDQTARLKKFVQLGRMSRRQADEVLKRMNEGFSEGALRFADGPKPGVPRPVPPHIPARRRFCGAEPRRRPRAALVVGATGRGALESAAARLAERGFEVTLIDFSLRAKRLRVGFDKGVWRHSGGVLGRDRFEGALPAPRRCLRAKREIERVAPRRDFDVVVRPAADRYRIGDLRASPLGGALSGYVAEPLRLGGADETVRALSA